MKLLILQGLPGSGKSSWAKEFIKDKSDWVRVNRDELRSMRYPYWVPKQESLITEWEDFCVKSALDKGYNVILDATNLNKDRIKNKVKERFARDDLKVEYKFFDVPLETCINNDLKRENSVGEKVIRGMYEKYLKPNPAVYDEDPNLDECIICDIDGTLAKSTGRSPFEFDRVHEDEIIKPVLDILANYGGYIFLFTGRDDSCLDMTKGWLDKYNVSYHEIHARKASDNRKDSIVKKEMFENFVRGKYYCNFVIDDRKQVKRMWTNELGLFVFDVNQTDKEF